MDHRTRSKILERRARFVAAALAGLAGCHPIEEAPGGYPDAQADSARDAAPEVTPEVGTPEACLSPPAPPPVGDPCTSDSECNPTSFGDNECSLDAFGPNPILPTPVCIDTVSCGLDRDVVEECGRGTGVCAGSVCWPKCTFDATGSEPVGCLGKNACTALSNGTGFCFAACVADADCPKGSVCQPESGWCVEKRVAFTKPMGAPCTAADDSIACHCVLGEVEDSPGYCTNICRAGGTSCPAGFTCDVRLPLAEFPKVPPGLLGHCAKNCSTDADCPAGPCVERAGTSGQKVCALGPALRR